MIRRAERAGWGRSVMRGLGVGAVTLGWTLAAQAQGLLVQDLGALTERSSGGADINAAGQVCGSSAITGGCWERPDGTIYCEAWIGHGFFWPGGPLLDLGVLGDDPPAGVMPRPSSAGVDLNDAGWIAGESCQPNDVPQAFAWLPEPAAGLPAGMNQLPQLLPGPYEITRAHGVNNANQLAGESHGGSGAIPSPRAVRWDLVGGAWQITDLGTLDGQEDRAARARAINDLGQVVGYSANSPFHNSLEPCLWLPAPAYGLPAGPNAINPTHGGGDAAAINDLGQIVGHSGATRPWVWLPAPAYGLPAGLNELGQFPHPTVEWTKLTDINNNGQIVGYFRYTRDELFHEVRAFIWENGEYTLIDDLLPPHCAWSMHQAHGINDAGQITGSAESDRFWYQDLPMAHAVVLTPTSPLGDVDADQDVDLDDFAALLACLAGPDESPAAGCNAEQARRADLQGDGDIDAGDFASWQVLMSGN